MPITWYNGHVHQIEDITPSVKRFWVQVPAETPFSFLAGQFVTMDLPIGEKRLQRWRSYSIANAPDGSGMLEFCIVRNPNGEATRYLFETLKPGDTLRFKGPDGAFFLPEIIEKDIVMICTGTGVAPFRSMLLDLQQSGRPHRNIHLIFGTREMSGVLYKIDFERLMREMPGFQYDVVLSRQADWDGYQGHVHQVYVGDYRQVRPDVDFYLCGWSNMIDEAVVNLMVQLGYDRSQVHYELYG